MNTSGSAYTHLESLRLFQYLHAYGVNASVFASISDLLTKDPDVTSNKYFQPGRLSPDALRNFYLERLRKEIEYEQNVDPEAGNGDVTNAKKRKLPAAPLPSVQESLQHQHLIPKLVTKLYASYRKDITEQIRQDEERYDALLREVQSIEAGEWNDHLKEKLRASASRSPTSSKKSPLVAQKPSPANNEVARQNGTPGAPGDATLADHPPPNGQSTSSPTSPRRKQTSAPPPRPSSATQPLAASPVPPNSQPQARIQQPQQPTNQPYNAPPVPNFTPYPPGPQLHPPQSSPHQHAAHLPNRQSPVMGPHGPQFQHPPPVYNGNGPPPYPPGPGGPQAYLPPQQRYPYQQSPGPQSPGVQPAHPQRSPYAQSGMPPYAPLQPHMGQHPPPQAGFMLPPFQVAPQDPSRVHPQAATPSQPPQVSTPSSNRQQPRSNVQTPVVPRPGIAPAHPLVNQARQPFATPVSTRSPLSAVGTPTSARSLWKRQSLPASAGSRASPRPEPEPIDDFEPLVRTKTSPAKPKSQRKPRGKGKSKEKEAELESAAVPEATEETKQSHEREDEEEDAANEMETRSGRTTRRKAAPKRTRARSIASSRAAGSVRGRSRSQSVLSHTETVAADNESQAGNRIKSERGTSADVMEEDHIGTPSQVSTRRRGATTQAASSTRRKRNAREASLEEAEDHFSTPGPLKSVIAQRGFSRMCDPIMNDIKSHRHASTFTSAVRAKDAEGYYDIIKRPTDLKTIQKAIAFGSKQVAAAASTDTPVGSPGGNGAVVELPMTLENIPPKSIVNASQLEKELMRMFVNAVMFNPGEEGVVEDAREMFESVGRSVSTWRNVERGAGSGSGGARTEAEETPVAEEEAVSQVSKRQRKL